MSVRRRTWLSLKEEYLLLQKRSMTSLKKCMTKMDERPEGGSSEFTRAENPLFDPQHTFFCVSLQLKSPSKVRNCRVRGLSSPPGSS